MLASFTSCKTRYIEVPVETVRIDSAYNAVIRRDSVFCKDSIYIVEKGDTVRETRFKYVYKDRVKVDTLIKVERDTITNIVTVEIEKKLSLWERIKVDFGGVAIWLIVLAIVIYLVKKRVKF